MMPREAVWYVRGVMAYGRQDECDCKYVVIWKERMNMRIVLQLDTRAIYLPNMPMNARTNVEDTQ